MGTYRKAIAALIITVLAAIPAVLAAPGWKAAVIAGATAATTTLAVYLTPNAGKPS